MAYPTNTDAKTYLAISGSGDDTFLTQLVNASKGWVERYCNRTFEAASATRSFPVGKRYKYVSRDGLRLSLFADLASLTSVTNGDGIAVNTSTELDLHPLTTPYHEIRLRPTKGKYFWDGGSNTPIAVVGTWGYAATCPTAIFEAIVEIAVGMYRARQSGGQSGIATRSGVFVQGFQIPEATLAVLDSFKRMAV